jgi:hypothetical protein
VVDKTKSTQDLVVQRPILELTAFSHTHQFYGVFESRTIEHKSFLGERGHLQAVEA